MTKKETTLTVDISDKKAASNNTRDQTSNEESRAVPAGTASLDLPQVTPSNEMNTNATSGPTVSLDQLSAGISHTQIPFSPSSVSQLDRLLDPIEFNNETNPNSDHVSPPVVLGDDLLSFEKFMDWQPSTTSTTSKRHSDSENKSPQLSSAKISQTQSSNYDSENWFPLVSDSDYISHARPRLNSLNSPCPSEDLTRTQNTVTEFLASNLNSQSQQHQVQLVSRDTPGTLSNIVPNQQHPSLAQQQSLPYDNSKGPRNNILQQNLSNIYQLKPTTEISGPLRDKNSPAFSRRESSEPSTTLGRRSSSGSFEDETIHSGSTSPTTGRRWRHLIHTCCEAGHVGLVEELVEAGLDINKRDSAGNTPLHIAANAGNEEVMLYLVEKGCDINAINHAGWTAAHLASVKGHRRCLRVLLELDVSPWARLTR